MSEALDAGVRMVWAFPIVYGKQGLCPCFCFVALERTKIYLIYKLQLKSGEQQEEERRNQM